MGQDRRSEKEGRRAAPRTRKECAGIRKAIHKKNTKGIRDKEARRQENVAERD